MLDYGHMALFRQLGSDDVTIPVVDVFRRLLKLPNITAKGKFQLLLLKS